MPKLQSLSLDLLRPGSEKNIEYSNYLISFENCIEKLEP